MVVARSITHQRVLQVAETLPTTPRVLAELRVLLQDANKGLDEIAALLRQDIGLTSRVLRIANGVMFSQGDAVGSLEEALGRIGFKEVYRLAGMAALAQMASFELAYYGMSALRLRENALLVALLMEELSPAAELDARVAYTIGLMRPTSRIVLDATAQQDLRDVAVPPLGARRVAEWESEVFGITGQEVNAAVLRSWRFPPEVYVPIRDHYLHALAVDPMPAAKVLHVAATLAEMRGFGLPGESGYWEAGVEAAAEARGIDQAVADDAGERAMERFEQLRAVLDMG